MIFDCINIMSWIYIVYNNFLLHLTKVNKISLNQKYDELLIYLIVQFFFQNVYNFFYTYEYLNTKSNLKI